MTVLVTGGAGFIGSHIVEHFQGSGRVRVLENYRSGYARNIELFEVELIKGSILDRDCVRRAMKGVDVVFHLAAMVSVPESMGEPIKCNELNIAGTLIVLEEAARAGVKRLVFSSSAAIYGNNPTVPKEESMLPEPKSPYAITKLDGEYYCNLFTQERRLATACLRYFNVFGPRQDPQSQYAAAVPIFIERALKNAPITIHGDGNQTRDFVYVKDIAAANAFFGTETDCTGVFNVGCGRRMTINELAKTIVRLTKSSSPILHAEARAGDVRDSMASIERLRRAGFAPRTVLAEGLDATIQFFKGDVPARDSSPA